MIKSWVHHFQPGQKPISHHNLMYLKKEVIFHVFPGPQTIKWIWMKINQSCIWASVNPHFSPYLYVLFFLSFLFFFALLTESFASFADEEQASYKWKELVWVLHGAVTETWAPAWPRGRWRASLPSHPLNKLAYLCDALDSIKQTALDHMLFIDHTHTSSGSEGSVWKKDTLNGQGGRPVFFPWVNSLEIRCPVKTTGAKDLRC